MGAGALRSLASNCDSSAARAPDENDSPSSPPELVTGSLHILQQRRRTADGGPWAVARVDEHVGPHPSQPETVPVCEWFHPRSDSRRRVVSADSGMDRGLDGPRPRGSGAVANRV